MAGGEEADMQDIDVPTVYLPATNFGGVVKYGNTLTSQTDGTDELAKLASVSFVDDSGRPINNDEVSGDTKVFIKVDYSDCHKVERIYEYTCTGVQTITLTVSQSPVLGTVVAGLDDVYSFSEYTTFQDISSEGGEDVVVSLDLNFKHDRASSTPINWKRSARTVQGQASMQLKVPDIMSEGRDWTTIVGVSAAGVAMGLGLAAAAREEYQRRRKRKKKLLQRLLAALLDK